ncbi:hypothetical protein AB0O07_32685 [Streptomyces sp. NPDC093085]|uniref:DUF7144 family membrane protein n=1 Tax=Streptomyces sp. NPDC093085 TaxID=3155068 RepID=UPI0034233942
MFAGVLMLVTGATNILQGVAAVRHDSILRRLTGYAYTFNLTSWGWIHIAIGIVLACVGFALLARMGWARYAGIAIAALNLVAQFMYLPRQPVWAVVGMALSAFIIWALANDRYGFGAGGGSRGGSGYGART